MTLSDWLTFRFPKDIRLEGASSAVEFMENLTRITAPSFSFAKVERQKPLRGKLEGTSGVIRWPLNEYRFVSPRSLHFDVIESSSGVTFKGRFIVWLGFRIIVSVWLWVGCLFTFEQVIVPGLFYHAGARFIEHELFLLLPAFAMAYGYTWFCIAAGRGREKDVVRVLSLTIRDSKSAEVTRELLIRP